MIGVKIRSDYFAHAKGETITFIFYSFVVFILQFVLEKSQTRTLSSNKSLQTALPGSSVTLRCVAAHSQSHDSVHWYREHLQLPQSAQVDGEYLTISNLQQADAGRYYCEVRVRGGGTVSDYVDVEIECEYSLCCTVEAIELQCSNCCCSSPRFPRNSF